MLDIDSGVDNKADKCEEEAGRDKREAPPCPVASKGQDEKHHGTRHVRRHRVEVRLHGTISEPADDLWQEQLNGLKRNSQADLDGEDNPASGVFKNSEPIVNVEFFINDGRAVKLHTLVGQLPFFWGEERSLGARPWEVPKGKGSNQNGAASFDQKQVAPVGQWPARDPEDTVSKKARKGRRDALSRVEDCKSAREFTATIEPTYQLSAEPWLKM